MTIRSDFVVFPGHDHFLPGLSLPVLGVFLNGVVGLEPEVAAGNFRLSAGFRI